MCLDNGTHSGRPLGFHPRLGDDLPAVVVIDAARDMPRAKLLDRPAQALVHPTFPVVGIEAHEIEAEFRGLAGSVDLDFRDHQRHPQRTARSLGWSHALGEAPAKFIDAIERQRILFARPETAINERHIDRHAIDRLGDELSQLVPNLGLGGIAGQISPIDQP